MKKDIELQHHKIFEEIKQIDKNGNEFCNVRALQNAKKSGLSPFFSKI